MPNLIGNSLDAQIVRMVKALFDAAPGYTFLTALKAQGSVQSVSESLNANFSSLSNAQWASLIATNLKLTGGAATAAQNYLIGQLNSGVTRVALLPAAMQGLTNLESDGTFGAAAAYFNASNATAYAYSINPANTTTDLAILQTKDEPPPPNRAPVAGNDTNSATEGGAVIAGTVAVNDSDPDGDTLTYQLAPTQAPVAGFTLNANGGYTFDPTVAAYNDIAAGATRSVVINLWVRDGQTQTPSTLTITVTGTNDAPTAAAVVASGNEDSTITVTPSATDPDAGDTLAYAVNTQPGNGSVVLNANGTFTYTPRANFNGTDSFTYRVTDAAGMSSIAVATVTVAGVNDTPAAIAQSVTGAEGSAISGVVTGTDIDGDTLTYALGTAPTNGTVTINQATGAFVYTPNAGYVGADSFTYTVSDGNGGTSAPATVSVTVTDVPNILTSSVDVIALTGSGPQMVLGNESTYNSGDSITGGSGDGDILRLQLNPGSSQTVSSARVTGIETFQISSNPTATNLTNLNVGLLMTNVGTDLKNIELNRSTAQNISISDIQVANSMLPVVKINDVGAITTINFDQQDVAGTADTLKVELNEFGTNSSSTLGRSELYVTSGNQRVETIEITDKATGENFASDMGVLSGTYSKVNILGGAADVPLTIFGGSRNTNSNNGGFASNASTVTVDSTAFAGNLIADVDGADTVLAGPGHDYLEADENVAGLLSTGAGNDEVNLSGDLSNGDLSGTITTGMGDDTVNVNGGLLNTAATSSSPARGALVETGDGADLISIGEDVSSMSTVDAGDGDDDATVNGTLAGKLLGGGGADTLGVFGGVSVTGSVEGGEGNDEINIEGTVEGSALGGAGDDAIQMFGTLGNNSVVVSPAARGLLSGGDGNDSITLDGFMSEGSRIDGGAGDDVISVSGTIQGNLVDPGLTPVNNSWQTAAVISGGDGNDTVNISNSFFFDGTVDTGAGNDTVNIAESVVESGDVGEDTSNIVLGDGDDSVKITNGSWLSATADALGNDDNIAGGAGADSMTLESISTFPTQPAQTANISFGSQSTNGSMRATFVNNGVVPAANVVVTVSNGATVADTLAALAAAINANATVSAYWSAAISGGSLVLTTLARGNGVPVVTFTNAQTVSQAGATVDTDAGPIIGGAAIGGDRSSVVTSDGVGTLVTGDSQDGTDITGIETLNLTTADGFNGDENPAVAGVQDNEWDHTFSIALEAYDSALTTINLLERDDSATVNLTGYASEQINIDSDGRSKVTGDADDVDAADVTLNILDTQTSAARAANIALNGTAAYSTIINDDARINVMNLAINGTGNRTVTLDSADQDNNDTVGGEGNTLNITGDNVGTHTITGIYQETVAAGGFGGNLNLTIANDGDGGNETLSITTGSGNDVINMVADRLDYTVNVSTGAVTGDSINGGAGTDRLIIDNSTTTSGNSIDQDFVFKRITSIEELEVRGNDGGVLNVSIENDANITGIRKVIASNNAAVRGNINLNFESDFAVGGVAPAVVVDVESSDIVIDNGANSNMALNLFAARASAGGTASGVYAGFVAASGTGSGVVDVNVTINGTGTTWVGGVSNLAGGFVANVGAGVASGLASGVAGVVILDTQIGTIDSLTLTDNGTTDNAVNVTWNDAWANGVASFPVTMALVNNDSTAGGGGLTTGGVNFVGVAEDDTGFNITASANNDTIWGGQSNDVISAGAGNDFINADPTIGQVVAPGQQQQRLLTFTEQTIEAGDRLQAIVGGRTFTWTAPAGADGQLLSATTAMADLVSAINGGTPATVSAVGNIDDGNNLDDVTASASGLQLAINGIGLDATFGYALGENIAFSNGLTAVQMNRPTATIGVVSEGYDVGDVLTLTINSTNYTATVRADIDSNPGNGIQPETAASLAAQLAAAVNGGALMTAEVSGNNVVLRGNTASTAYTISPSWTADAVTTPATSKTVSVTYSAIGGTDSVSVTFGGGITVSSTTVAGLAAAINGNGTLAPQWNASSVGNTLTLATDVAGAANPANDFGSAAYNGSGSASWTVTAGTNATVRTDNTDPSVAARVATFTFADGQYDAGDVVNVTVNGVTTPVTLGSGSDATNDVNLTGAQVAAQVSAAVNFAGVADSASGNQVTFNAGAGNTATYSVTLTDIARPTLSGTSVGPIAEVVSMNYTNAVVAGSTTFTAVINGVTVSGANLAALTAAINANGSINNGTNGMTASLLGNVITLTGASSGAEPFGIAEPNDPVITGAGTSSGGAVTVNAVPAVPAIPRVVTLDFNNGATLDATDGAIVWIDADGAGPNPAIGYVTLPGGSEATTLNTMVSQLNTLGTGYTFSRSGETIVATGPANGSTPTADITTIDTWDNAAAVTIGAPTLSTRTTGEIYTITLTPTPSTPGITSISVSFDTDGIAGPTVGDTVLVGSSTTNLAALINSNPGLALNGLTAVAAGPNSLVITGPSSGVGSTTPPVQVNVTGDGTGAVALTTPANNTPTPWSQVFTINEIGAGEDFYLVMSDGYGNNQFFAVDEATTLAALGTQLNTRLFGGAATVVVNAGANTITVTGPTPAANAPAINPSVSVSTVFVGLRDAANVAVTTPGAAGTPAVTTLTFTQWDAANESGSVTFANGETISATWQGSLAASLTALAAAINADTATNGQVSGANGWTATVAGNDLVLTGPAGGAAPVIAYASSAITATTTSSQVEVVESWVNADNTNPTVTVVSGAANTVPSASTSVAPIAALTATANGNDSVSGGDGNDTINGLGGNDTLFGDAGNDVLDGGDGNDQTWGGAGDDFASGGNGNDVMVGAEGNDTMDGGSGNDNVGGGDGADRLTGSDGNDTVDGGAGDDFIRGGGGRDVLTGGDGTDVFYFSAIGTPSESQGAVNFADVVTDFVSNVDKFQFDFAVNFYANVTNTTNLLAGLTDVSPAAGPAAGRAIFDSSAKILFVDVNGDGAITLSDDIVIDLTQTNVTGLTASDFIAPSGSATITGTAGNDLLIGNGASQVLLGVDGDDTLFGANGIDTLTGGNGADTFHFASSGDAFNTIVDFASGTDKLQFTSTTIAYAGTATNAGTAATALGSVDATLRAVGKAVLVPAASSTTDGTLYIDTDGNGVADIALTLTGVTSLSQADFLAPEPAPGL